MGMGRSQARLLRWAAPAAVGALVLLFVVQGGNRPIDPYLGGPVGATPGAGSVTNVRIPIEGFGEVAFRIDSSNTAFGTQSVAMRCALLADTPALRSKGLMGQRDLSGYDGMIFQLDTDQNIPFIMTDTLIPLTVAFFDSSGTFVSSTDMTPCLDQPTCPPYPAARPYRTAIEVPQGRLESLGIGPRARLIVESAKAGC